MKDVLPTEKHKAFRQEMIALLKTHAGHLDGLEMLALAAYTVGQLVAMQDQRKVTGPMAMEVVSQNVQRGNRDAIAEVMAPKGSGGWRNVTR